MVNNNNRYLVCLYKLTLGLNMDSDRHTRARTYASIVQLSLSPNYHDVGYSINILVLGKLKTQKINNMPPLNKYSSGYHMIYIRDRFLTFAQPLTEQTIC